MAGTQKEVEVERAPRDPSSPMVVITARQDWEPASSFSLWFGAKARGLALAVGLPFGRVGRPQSNEHRLVRPVCEVHRCKREAPRLYQLNAGRPVPDGPALGYELMAMKQVIFHCRAAWPLCV